MSTFGNFCGKIREPLHQPWGMSPHHGFLTPSVSGFAISPCHFSTAGLTGRVFLPHVSFQAPFNLAESRRCFASTTSAARCLDREQCPHPSQSVSDRRSAAGARSAFQGRHGAGGRPALDVCGWPNLLPELLPAIPPPPAYRRFLPSPLFSVRFIPFLRGGCHVQI